MRYGIRHLLRRRLVAETADDPAGQEARKAELIASMRAGPIALATHAANAQHYEVPPEFFRACLGPHLKYSSCLYAHGDETLAEAEAAMLALTCERAELGDGQDILELGCGWGSLSLWMAQHCPQARITAVTNSRLQCEFIEARRHARGLRNLGVVRADMNEFDVPHQFDRVVSVEMFEHMRNYEALMAHITRWLKPAGKLFVHIFCHRELAYPFVAEGADNWMGRHFFSGGLMPSFDLLLHFQHDLLLQRRWWVNGSHYALTCEDWLRNCDATRASLLELFTQDAGVEVARRLQRWRMFFAACAELFAYRGGREWGVGHYLFSRR